MKSFGETIQIKATEQHFPVVPCRMLCKVVLTLMYLVKILKCDHSNESYWVVFSVFLFIYFDVHRIFKLWDLRLHCHHSNTKESFPLVPFLPGISKLDCHFSVGSSYMLQTVVPFSRLKSTKRNISLIFIFSLPAFFTMNFASYSMLSYRFWGCLIMSIFLA